MYIFDRIYIYINIFIYTYIADCPCCVYLDRWLQFWDMERPTLGFCFIYKHVLDTHSHFPKKLTKYVMYIAWSQGKAVYIVCEFVGCRGRYGKCLMGVLHSIQCNALDIMFKIVVYPTVTFTVYSLFHKYAHIKHPLFFSFACPSLVNKLCTLFWMQRTPRQLDNFM